MLVHSGLVQILNQGCKLLNVKRQGKSVHA